MPMLAALDKLDKEALVSILTQPKNAIVKQYKKLLELEGVELVFTDDALETIAEEALKRKTGARGLRSIIENAMLDVMFDAPNDSRIKEVVITSEVIKDGAKPVLVYHKEAAAG